MRRLLVIASVIGALALPATAAALEPTRTTVHVTTRNAFTCPNGATLANVFDVTREITTFYDNDGTPVRELWVASFEGITTNTSTGASLTNFGVRVFHRDLVTGELVTTGTNVVTKLPDGGVAIGGAGRFLFDAQGRQIEHNGPDMADERLELCAALTG